MLGLTALALTLLVPAALGHLAGVRPGPAFLLLTLLVVGVLAAPSVPIAETAAIALAFALGLVARATSPARVGFACLLFVATAELASRMVSADELRAAGGAPEVLAPPEALSPACHLGAPSAATWTHDTPSVLHLGDSMTAGAGVRLDEAFPARLDGVDGRHHLNAGVVDAGPDCALHMARLAPPADLVILHLFPPNDLWDLRRGYAWCGGLPLLDHSDPTLPSRCEGPGLPMPLWYRAYASPAPYSLRAASLVSVAAARAVHVWEAWRYERLIESASPQASAEQLVERFIRIIARLDQEVAARGGTFAVTVLPFDITEPMPSANNEAEYRRIVAALETTGVPFWDATHALDDAYARELPDLFTDLYPGDPHFGPQGHARFAEMLAPRIAAGFMLDTQPP